jgi:hypothetical protein
MFGWLKKWRRPKGPVVQVQTHEFSFPPTDESLLAVETLVGIDPQCSVAFWTTNIPHHLDVEITEQNTLVVTRVGAASDDVEATVRVVEFRQ